MLTKIKHIFFDLDDTLWDFEKNSSIVLTALFSEYNLQEKLNASFEEFHNSYKKVNHALWSRYYRGEIDKQFLRNHRFNETFKLFSYDNYAENLLVTEQYLLRSPYGTHLKHGCIEVLDYLKPKYQLHIITNGFKEVQEIKIDQCGLRSYFSNIIISEEHGFTKPDVRIFRLSEQRAGTSAEQCLMIGDNFESDIEGASAAGWRTYWLNENAEEKHHSKIHQLHELKNLL